MRAAHPDRAGTRRAYRRPVTAADVDPLLELFALGRTGGARFEDGIEMALSGVLVSPSFLFRAPRAPEDAAPGSVHPLVGRRPRVAALLLPLEQHPGRRAARPRGAGPPVRTGRAGPPGRADARRPEGAGARRQLRRAVAAPAERRRLEARPRALPRLRRVAAPRVRARDGAVPRSPDPRRRQRAGPDRRGVQLPERASRPLLRRRGGRTAATSAAWRWPARSGAAC